MAKKAQFIRLAREGVKSVGQYRAGVEYEVGKDVDDKEAERLVKVKGFEFVSAPAQQKQEPAADDSGAAQGGE